MRPKTLGELKNSGYRDYSIREEIRNNLVSKIKKGEEIFPGIIGYHKTVIPHIINAVLAGHDIIFLGERGQAKTRLMRNFVNLLDAEIPVIEGCEINDHPYRPVCRRCRKLYQEKGDHLPITWKSRNERYTEKLATPDVTIADLIGEVDPIKVAEGRYLSDETTIHFGLVPRSNRGIFAINELPDLAEKIQVGLFNLMEERDIQIRGFTIRLPLEVFLLASANPEDYTNRGRIITPLKDRFGSEIRTHYPVNWADEIAIVEQEQKIFPLDGYKIISPQFMKEIVVAISHQARKHPEVDQRSGVSVRMSISNYETIISNALQRAIRLEEEEVVPRISDLPAAFASSLGKIEWFGLEEKREDKIFSNIIREAIRKVFTGYFSDANIDAILKNFNKDSKIMVSEDMPSRKYVEQAQAFPNLQKCINQIIERKSPAVFASALEFILESLYLKGKLHKEEIGTTGVYRS
jgi:magnesium chelatase subunit I